MNPTSNINIEGNLGLKPKKRVLAIFPQDLCVCVKEGERE
jgi:hypothetical protein